MFGFPEIVPKKSFFFAPFGRLEKQNPTKFSSRGSFTAYQQGMDNKIRCSPLTDQQALNLAAGILFPFLPRPC